MPLQLHDLGQYLRLVDSYDQLVRYAEPAASVAELFRAVEGPRAPRPDAVGSSPPTTARDLASHRQRKHAHLEHSTSRAAVVVAAALLRERRRSLRAGVASARGREPPPDLFPTRRWSRRSAGTVRAPEGRLVDRALAVAASCAARARSTGRIPRVVFAQRKPLPEPLARPRCDAALRAAERAPALPLRQGGRRRRDSYDLEAVTRASSTTDARAAPPWRDRARARPPAAPAGLP